MAEFSKPILVQDQSKREVAVITIFGILAIGLSALAREICEPDPAMIRWIPFMVFGACTLGLVLLRTRIQFPNFARGWKPLIAIPIIFFVYMIYAVADAQRLIENFNEPIAIFVATIVIFALALTARTFLKVYPAGLRAKHAAEAALIFTFSTACLLTTTNFRHINAIFFDANSRGAWEFILIAATGAFTWRALIAPLRLPSHKILSVISSLITFALFSLLAFRTDRLFEEGSITHWEFYVGVIRTLRNGGTMLWDAPSQYGYLNIFIASLFPGESAWQSFYLFQSILSLAVGMGIYATLRSLLPKNLYYWLFATLVAGILFVADSKLIGPQPYPSGSVARFAPVYFLIFYFVYLSRSTKIWQSYAPTVCIAALWAFGIFWSAESGIYTSVITVSGIASWLYVMSRGQRQQLRRTTGNLAAIIIVGAILITTYTYLRSGHLPELKAFVIYGLAYAGGYFSLEIPTWGPIWTVVFPIMLGSITAILEMRKSKPDPSLIRVVVAIAALWAIFSYYVGRAAPDNIIVIFPQIAMLLVVLATSRAVNNSRLPKALTDCLSTITLTYFFISTYMQSGVIPNIEHYTGYISEVMNILPAQPEELAKLLTNVGVDDNSAVLFLGDREATLPLRSNWKSLNFGKTWLPTPLTMLVDPMPAERRELIYRRFLEKNLRPGFLVHKKIDDEKSFPIIQSELEPYFTSRLVGESTDWQVFKYEPRP